VNKINTIKEAFDSAERIGVMDSPLSTGGSIEEQIGLYQMFKYPQSSLGDREYSFMTIGPISPLSFLGTPMFLTALKFPDEFLKINFG